MQPVLVDNGKVPDEPYNAQLGFWLPPNTPYGNLQLKLMKLCQRLDEANRRLIDSFDYWTQAIAADAVLSNAYERHIYATEQAVYLIRRSADEMISMMWLLASWQEKREYPQKIAVDCIGEALKQGEEGQLTPIRRYVNVLRALNEASNAFKHSFVHSDCTLIGRDEPYVNALALDRNRLAAGVEFHSFPLVWLVEHFSDFYGMSLGWLREFSKTTGVRT